MMMRCACGCLPLLLFLLLCFDVGNPEDHPPAHDCSNDSFYDTSSNSGRSYKNNLYVLFYTLTSNASTTTTNGFYNFTVGSVGSATDPIIYGLFLCLGNVACQQCVETATQEILKLCPNVKSADIWYDSCMLRYSNHCIFAKLDTRYRKYRETQLYQGRPPASIPFPDDLNLAIGDTIKQITNKAPNSDKRFDTVDKVFTSQWRLQALAQCTPDISSSDCGTCLQGAINGYLPNCCVWGATVILGSCEIMYQAFPSSNGISTPATTKGKSQHKSIVIALSIIVSSILVFIISIAFLKRRSLLKRLGRAKKQDAADGDDITIDPESLQYSLSEIELATNIFSSYNKIGQGGFGGVFKGKLPNGQDIAVKRLSRSSNQGGAEFKNEIRVVAKLQHRNLVRLLGFCLEGEEKVLVYEFVPNKSLDYFLFGSEKQRLLNWSRRHNIIAGIARGLLYLHEDSRLKIVHRDLKAGNILLDENLHPKIADFGMAKIFTIDQSEGSTTRIAGTFGYMAPEYTRSGQYSIKSDVFSFGVVVLEIITGKKNSTFYRSEYSEDLISHVWRHWRDGTPLALLDPTIGDSYVKNEVIQNLHVGLLCVEEDANRRPTMPTVVNMLTSTSVSLPTPHRPAIRGSMSQDSEFDRASNKLVPPESINMLSITEPYPR